MLYRIAILRNYENVCDVKEQKQSVKMVFLKNFSKFTGNLPHVGISIEKETPGQVLSIELCEIFKNCYYV